MSKRMPSIVLKDMLGHLEHILIYTDKLTYEQFATNFMVVDACLYNIQILGEAVAQLADDIKERESTIPWTLIKGMRNRLIHQYFGTDLEVVWNVIKHELPGFQTELQRILKDVLEEGR